MADGVGVAVGSRVGDSSEGDAEGGAAVLVGASDAEGVGEGGGLGRLGRCLGRLLRR